MKLSIGTVQFGIPYGINNSIGIPTDIEIKNIFSLAYSSDISDIDTAAGYGNAEEKIGNLAGQKFKIVTKFPAVADSKELKAKLSESLERLKTDSVFGYIAHNADTLITYPELWQDLLNTKKNKKVDKIGYSLYSTQQLEKLLALNLIPDLVQLPYSLLDRKFEKYFPQLKKLGTEIHTRSAFLQGLYFKDPKSLSEKLNPLQQNLQDLHQCCNQAGITIGALALNFVLQNKYIDKVVIGIESVAQLQENITVSENWKQNSGLIEKVCQIEVIHKELLNPVNW